MNLAQQKKAVAIQYREFLLLEQPNKTWLIRPIKSPMIILPFRTSICSLSQAKGILDKKLYKEEVFLHHMNP